MFIYSKCIFTWAGGIVGRKSFSALEYVCVILISVGVIMFTVLKNNSPGLASENYQYVY